jgi:hypothetical protein
MYVRMYVCVSTSSIKDCLQQISCGLHQSRRCFPEVREASITAGWQRIWQHKGTVSRRRAEVGYDGRGLGQASGRKPTPIIASHPLPMATISSPHLPRALSTWCMGYKVLPYHSRSYAVHAFLFEKGVKCLGDNAWVEGLQAMGRAGGGPQAHPDATPLQAPGKRVQLEATTTGPPGLVAAFRGRETLALTLAQQPAGLGVWS